MKLVPGHYDDRGTLVIFLGPEEAFPSFGFPKKTCPHPSIYAVYAEWESNSLGHGWFCALCGEWVQAG